MYTHILIPIDDSELSETAIGAGIRFAKSIGAKVTGFIAEPEYEIPTLGDSVSGRGMSMAQHEAKAREHAEACLERIAVRAREAGVEFHADYAQSNYPHEAIITAAGKNGCDLILMATHGRRGLSALLHGSETREVMSRAPVPVLVYR